MIEAVIDTNVFISGLFWEGKPKAIVKLALSRKIVGVTSPAILEELEEKLLKKFNYPKEQVNQFIQAIVKEFSVVEPKIKVFVVQDQKDNKIIEAAIESNAHYIVTGDTDLLKLKEYEKTKIVTPSEFMKLI